MINEFIKLMNELNDSFDKINEEHRKMKRLNRIKTKCENSRYGLEYNGYKNLKRNLELENEIKSSLKLQYELLKKQIDWAIELRDKGELKTFNDVTVPTDGMILADVISLALFKSKSFERNNIIIELYEKGCIEPFLTLRLKNGFDLFTDDAEELFDKFKTLQGILTAEVFDISNELTDNLFRADNLTEHVRVELDVICNSEDYEDDHDCEDSCENNIEDDHDDSKACEKCCEDGCNNCGTYKQFINTSDVNYALAKFLFDYIMNYEK